MEWFKEAKKTVTLLMLPSIHKIGNILEVWKIKWRGSYRENRQQILRLLFSQLLLIGSDILFENVLRFRKTCFIYFYAFWLGLFFGIDRSICESQLTLLFKVPVGYFSAVIIICNCLKIPLGQIILFIIFLISTLD